MICRKCKKEFPVHKVIDGKLRNFQNRKFCLDCSPFGSRNTKPDDPSRPTKRFPRAPYREWSEEDKERNRRYQYRSRQSRKLRLIKLKGGKCKTCGYDKCTRALTFHHRDPETKLIELNTRYLMSNPWNVILQEVDKCDLLCFNCHFELEAEKSTSRYT